LSRNSPARSGQNSVAQFDFGPKITFLPLQLGKEGPSHKFTIG